jgi:hypothetical protein
MRFDAFISTGFNFSRLSWLPVNNNDAYQSADTISYDSRSTIS